MSRFRRTTRRAHPGHADPSRTDLGRTDPSRTDPSHADPSHADPSHADPSHADPSHADPSHADLSRTDLSRTDLSHTDLSRTDPRHADLSHADLSHADLSHADLSRADPRRAASGSDDPRRAREVVHRPLYARALHLRHLSPGGILCFVFLEGAIALGILFALAELVSWWGVVVLPVTVAAMVKLNDVIAGLLGRSAAPAKLVAARAAVLHPAAAGGVRRANIGEESTTRLSGAAGTPASGERLGTHQQWVRQSATRRYE